MKCKGKKDSGSIKSCSIVETDVIPRNIKAKQMDKIKKTKRIQFIQGSKGQLGHFVEHAIQMNIPNE